MLTLSTAKREIDIDPSPMKYQPSFNGVRKRSIYLLEPSYTKSLAVDTPRHLSKLNRFDIGLCRGGGGGGGSLQLVSFTDEFSWHLNLQTKYLIMLCSLT